MFIFTIFILYCNQDRSWIVCLYCTCVAYFRLCLGPYFQMSFPPLRKMYMAHMSAPYGQQFFSTIVGLDICCHVHVWQKNQHRYQYVRWTSSKKKKNHFKSKLLSLNMQSAASCVGVGVSFVQVHNKRDSLHFAESSYKLWRPLHSFILERFVQRGCINVFWQGHYEYFRYLGPAITHGLVLLRGSSRIKQKISVLWRIWSDTAELEKKHIYFKSKYFKANDDFFIYMYLLCRL